MSAHAVSKSAPTDRRPVFPRFVETAVAVGVLVFFCGTLILPFAIGIGDLSDLTEMRDPAKAGRARGIFLVIYSLILVLAAVRPAAIATLLVENWLVLGFLGLLLASTVWSVDPAATLRGGVALSMTTFFCIYLYAGFGSDGGATIMFRTLLGLAILSLAISPVVPGIAFHVGDEHAGSLRGVFVHKNVAGNIAVWMLSFCLFLAARRSLSPRASVLSVALIFVFLVLTRSMTSLFVALLVLAAFAAMLAIRREIRVVALFATVLFILVFGATVLVLSEPGKLAELLGRDPTFSGRVIIWDEVLRLIGERPLRGYGYSAIWDLNFGPLYRLISDWGIGAGHNAYLDLALDVGIPGLALFLVLAADLFRKAFVLARYGDWAAGAFGIMILVTALTLSLSESILPAGHKIHWVCVVFAIVLVNRDYRAFRAATGRSANTPATMPNSR